MVEVAVSAGAHSTGTTTVQISLQVRRHLNGLKRHRRETYNQVIERLLEDRKEISPAFKRRLERASLDVKEGRLKTHEEVRAELGL